MNRTLVIVCLFLFSPCVSCELLEEPPTMIPAASGNTAAALSPWTTWTKRSAPVFSGQYSVCSDPCVYRDKTGYRMYYTGLDPETSRTILCAARSDDGLSWQEIDSSSSLKGMVLCGKSGAWDENMESAYVIPWKGKYWMYYSGYRDKGTISKGFPAALGVATSDDQNSFKQVSAKPSLEPTRGGHDCDAIYSAVIAPEGDRLAMVYVGHAYTNDKNSKAPAGVFLLGASSEDGLKWTKKKEVVLEGSEKLPWTKDGVAEPALLHGPDKQWYLFFTGLKDEERVIGIAKGKSPFGPWEINPTPIITPTAGRFDEHQVLAPTVVFESGKLRMWYLGANKDGSLVCGYAESSWPIYQPKEASQPAKP